MNLSAHFFRPSAEYPLDFFWPSIGGYSFKKLIFLGGIPLVVGSAPKSTGAMDVDAGSPDPGFGVLPVGGASSGAAVGLGGGLGGAALGSGSTFGGVAVVLENAMSYLMKHTIAFWK